MTKDTIKVTTNGYWISGSNLYLDDFEYKTNAIISFDEFERAFYPAYLNYSLEWKGNNPFTRDECLRLWVSDNARVEIFVNDGSNGATFSICKVLSKDFNTSDELLLDLAKVGILYKDVLKSFNQYTKDYEL